MNIAVISFDQNLVSQLSSRLSGSQVKGYTDSLSLLREIDSFNPEVIVYDASGGELALNALEFFLSRDKVQGKTVKVLILRENQIDESILSKFENLDFYDKEKELDKLIEELSSVASAKSEAVEQQPAEEAVDSIQGFEESYQPPADMEALLGETGEPAKEEEIDLSEEIGSLEDVNELLKEMESVAPEEPEHKPEPPRPVEPPPAVEEPALISSVQPNSPAGSIKITIELSPEEIRKTVLEIAVEKLIEEIKNDADIQRIKEDLQKDFFDRVEKEMKDSVEEIKENIKKKLFDSIESDLKENIKQSIKEDVTRITTELVKEKLEQVFGSK
ncbi:hypothetical protein [Persephonella sp.]